MSQSASVGREDAAAYALGSLDAEAQAAFERLLASDASLGADVEAYRRVAGVLALAAPPAAPPAALRARVMTSEEAVHRISDAHLASSNAVRVSAPPVRRLRALPWLAVAASLAWAIVATRNAERERADHLAVMARNDSLRAHVASLDSVVAVLLAPEVETVSMSATGAPPRARMYWDPASGQVVLAAHRLPPAGQGRTYQLWGIPAGQSPVSLGTFNTDSSGTIQVSFTVPSGVTISVAAVTEEPAGGSPQPTTPPFLVGTFGG
jgi:anti-sigma-K factor RskA